MSCAPPALCLLLLAATALHGAEVTTSVSQGANSTSKVNFAMTNNDAGAIYNSAELRLQATIGEVLSAIFTSNPAVSGMSTADLIAGGFITGSIQPQEVDHKWFSSIDSTTALVTFFHVGIGYDVWQNTLSNPAQDTMVFTLNLGKSTATDPRLKNLLDFDGDSQLDAAERLLSLPPLTAAPDETSAGFVGIVDAFNSYPAAVNRFAVAGAWVERARTAAAHGVQRSGGDAVLTWQALHGLSYTLQTSLTLSSTPADWTPLSTQQRANTPGPELVPMTFTHSGAFAETRRFYRLVIEVMP